MNLLQLKYFQEVARYQNITRAADMLHISQPSLSASIKRLEEELGIALFDRKGKSILLNETGQEFLLDINSVFELLNRSQKNRQLLNSDKVKEIAIGGQNSELILSPMIYTFISENPDVLISFKNSVSAAFLDVGIFDFFVSTELVDHCSARQVILSPYRHSILMSKNHSLAQEKSVTLEMIKDEPFVFTTPQSSRMPPGYRLCREKGIFPNVTCITDERMVMLSIMKDSNFVSVVPEQDASIFTNFGEYVSFPINTATDRNIVLEVTFTKKLSNTSRAFLLALLKIPEIKRLNPNIDLSNM